MDQQPWGAAAVPIRIFARKIPFGLVVAQPYSMRRYWRFERGVYLALSFAMGIQAVAVVPSIRDFTPQSVDDPAMILLVMSVILGLSAWITAFKFPQNQKLLQAPVITHGVYTRFRTYKPKQQWER